MKRTVLNVQQGSREWLAARSASDGTASEAPAMLGKGKYQTRSELLEQKHTGLARDVDVGTQELFDRGHAAEAAARPMAEEIIGDDLSPTTLLLEVDGMKLLASLDGITFDDEVIWEHKLYSESLAEQVRAGELEEHYTIQMDQELLVSGAKKCLFMTSDGTREKCAWMWYESSKKKADSIVVGWQQFHKDLADYQPREIKEMPKAAPVDALPVPSIQVRGELVACNLAAITPAFDIFLSETSVVLNTDDDFAKGESDAKFSRETAKTLKLKAKEVVDQIAPVSEVVRTLEGYAAKFDALGLKLEKAVKEQKETIKTTIALQARSDFAAHVAMLEKETAPIRLNIQTPDFGGAMKSKRTIASLHDAVDTLMAQAKIEADAVARDVREKLSWCKANAEGYGFLFNDLQQIIYQPAEAFQIVVAGRIEQHKKAEAERLEAERERIRAEEEARAQQSQVEKNTTVDVPHKLAIGDGGAAPLNPTPNVADTGATIKLGQICERLGFTVTADFLRGLGFDPAGRQGAAMLYKESDFPLICNELVEYIQHVQRDFLSSMKQAA